MAINVFLSFGKAKCFHWGLMKHQIFSFTRLYASSCNSALLVKHISWLCPNLSNLIFGRYQKEWLDFSFLFKKQPHGLHDGYSKYWQKLQTVQTWILRDLFIFYQLKIPSKIKYQATNTDLESRPLSQKSCVITWFNKNKEETELRPKNMELTWNIQEEKQAGTMVVLGPF